MMGKKCNFRNLRKKVEKSTREKLFPKEEVTIDEIYEQFAEIPVKFRGAMKFLEIETELKLCFPRPSGKLLYQKAKEKGIKIIAVSDIYFEEALLTKLLNKNGFYFDAVFSSASIKKRKKTGNIYPLVASKMGVLPSEILHIGDNIISDVEQAKKNGFQTFYLPLLRDEINKNKLYKGLFKRENCTLTSASLGLLLERIDSEQNPIDKKSLFNNDIYNLGFAGFGAVIFAYTSWVFKMAQKNGIKKLFFVARDGFILHKAFEILYGNRGIESHYLECSRRSLLPIVINTKNDVLKHFTKRFRNSTVQDFITQKLECNPQKIVNNLAEIGFTSLNQKIKSFIYTKSQKQRLEKLVDFYADEILERVKGEKLNILNFLHKSNVLDGKLGLCDVGYGGTIQKILSSIKKEDEVFGFYLITNKESTTLKNCFGFLADGVSKIKFKIFTSFVRLIESVIFSAPFGTTIKYDENGNPILLDLQKVEKRRLEVNNLVWQGILDFVILLKKRFGEEADLIEYKKHSIMKMFLNFAIIPSKKDAKLIEGVVIENISNAGGYKDLIKDKAWKAGYIAVKKPFISNALTPFLKIFLKRKKLFDE
jgi:predicted HAD superfamily hydrolase